VPPGIPPSLPSDPFVSALTDLYDKAERKLDLLIAGAASRGAKGTEQFFTNQQTRVSKILADLRRQAQPLEAAATRSAYRGAVGTVDRVVDRSKAFSGVHTAAEEVLAANLSGRLRYAEEFVGRKANDAFRAIALEEVGVAIAGGIGPRQQAADLETRLRREGVTAFVDKRGKRWRLSVYAAMVTRTTTREASSVGMKNRMLEYGFDLVKISEHLHSCPICLPYQGKTFSLTGHDEHYPHLDRLPPFHPNCRHVLLPAPATFEEIEKELGLAPPESFPAEEPVGGPEPAPEPDRPETVMMGDRVVLEVAQRDTEEVVQQLEAIQKVHRIPKQMPEITVKTGKMKEFGGYALHYDPIIDSFAGEGIKLNRDALRRDEPLDSLVHELGHWLDAHFFDRKITGDRLRAMKQNELASGHEDDFREWRDAVKASDEVRRLTAKGGSRASYTLSTRELFARSYEQWIALRSGNKALRRKHEIMSGTKNYVVGDRIKKGEKDLFWTDESFAPIAEAFDRLFSTLGLLN
jgi:hypothetical protein